MPGVALSIEDKFEIMEAVNRFSLHADLGEWEQRLELYDDEIAFDYTAIGGEARIVSKSQLLPRWRAQSFFDAAQHLIGNVHILSGADDRAEARAYVHCVQIKNGRSWRAMGIYLIALRRTDHWRICGQKYTVIHEDGDLSLREEVMRRTKDATK
ncbi:MAG: nuclear transport factor 2 family protein [Steroidobacteraceae bacterium]